MTFLEVVFATAMLGMVVASIMGVMNFAISAEAKEQRRLGAAELANRLVLNYLDSPSGMPDPHKAIEYGPPEALLKYRWEYAEEPVRLVEPAGDQRDSARVSPLKNDRFRQVTVRVWLSEESGGSLTPEASTPSATLSRMLDPVTPRNPDSYMAMIKNPGDFERLIKAFMGNGDVSAPLGGGGGGSDFDRTQGKVPAGQAFGGARSGLAGTRALKGAGP